MLEPLNTIAGTAAPLAIDNIDTDVIMPKRFLKTITREGLGKGAFADLRFLSDGSENNEFILNRDTWRDASILVVGDNFGCGSSREYAVWGLYQLGIRAIVGTTYSGVFYDNCRCNGIAAISIDKSMRDRVLSLVAKPQSANLCISLEDSSISYDGGILQFRMPEDIRSDLMNGIDIIEKTLLNAQRILDYETRYPPLFS